MSDVTGFIHSLEQVLPGLGGVGERLRGASLDNAERRWEENSVTQFIVGHPLGNLPVSLNLF